MDTRREHGQYWPGARQESGQEAPPASDNGKVERVDLGRLAQDATAAEMRMAIRDIQNAMRPLATCLVAMLGLAVTAQTAAWDGLRGGTHVVTNEQDTVAIEALKSATNGLPEKIAAVTNGLPEKIAASTNGLPERIAASTNGLPERIDALAIAASERNAAYRIATMDGYTYQDATGVVWRAYSVTNKSPWHVTHFDENEASAIPGVSAWELKWDTNSVVGIVQTIGWWLSVAGLPVAVDDEIMDSHTPDALNVQVNWNGTMIDFERTNIVTRGLYAPVDRVKYESADTNAIDAAAVEAIVTNGAFTLWTILREGSNVTAHVQQPYYDAEGMDAGFVAWLIAGSILPEDIVGALGANEHPEGSGDNATELSWTSYADDFTTWVKYTAYRSITNKLEIVRYSDLKALTNDTQGMIAAATNSIPKSITTNDVENIIAGTHDEWVSGYGTLTPVDGQTNVFSGWLSDVVTVTLHWGPDPEMPGIQTWLWDCNGQDVNVNTGVPFEDAASVTLQLAGTYLGGILYGVDSITFTRKERNRFGLARLTDLPQNAAVPRILLKGEDGKTYSLKIDENRALVIDEVTE